MASISTQAGGQRTIQFVGADDRRRSIRLGKVPIKTAREIRTRVEYLHAAVMAGHAVDDDTAKWLRTIDDRLSEKLARVGLIPSRQTAALGRFISDYIQGQGPTVKKATVTTWRQCQRLLLEFFPADTPLRSISEGRAIQWRTYLLTRDHGRIKRARKLSESTIRKRCACARQFFEHAVRLQLIERNPFKSKRIPTTLPKPPQKAFIDLELAQKIMDRLPDWQYRLLFALARWGAVRVPSEPAVMTWADADWEQSRLTIHSPKTERHDGHERRVVPIFPELLGPLQEAWDAAEPGQVHVLPMLQQVTGSALRKPLLAAIKAAGVEPWPKLWTALRATRDTELRETFPVHVVEVWLGHEDRVAKRNYTQVTEEHYRRAVKPPHTEPTAKMGAAESGAQEVQNPVQHPTARECTELQPPLNTPTFPVVFAATDNSLPLGANQIDGDDRTRTCTPCGTRS